MEQIKIDCGLEIPQFSEQEEQEEFIAASKGYMPKQEVKINDIFVNTWGYEQTNVDFYKVVGLTKKSVKIQQLKQKTTETGFMCGNTFPLNEFEDDKVLTKRIQYDSEGKVFVRMPYGWCDLWEGKPESCSWYA